MSQLAGRRARMVRNALFDLRSGRLRSGSRATRHAAAGAHDTVNTDVTALERVFDGRVRDADVIVDVGCGKGRVVDWLARRYPANRVYGLELDADVASATRERVRRHPNAEIVTGDAIEQLPPDASLLYLFNPFSAPGVQALSERAKSLYRGRGVRVLYYNPVHADVFRGDPAWRVEDVAIGERGFHALCVIEQAPQR
jgi:SAM-dependent methyltransferase